MLWHFVFNHDHKLALLWDEIRLQFSEKVKYCITLWRPQFPENIWSFGQTREKPQTCKPSLQTFYIKMMTFEEKSYLFVDKYILFGISSSQLTSRHFANKSKFCGLIFYSPFSGKIQIMWLYPNYIDKSTLYTENWLFSTHYKVNNFLLENKVCVQKWFGKKCIF